jgi:hypothetical protein
LSHSHTHIHTHYPYIHTLPILHAHRSTIRIARGGDGGSKGSSSSVYQLEDTEGAALGEFDAVVVATPFAFSHISIVDDTTDGPSASSYPPRAYQTTHATFVEGAVRPGFFGPGTLWQGRGTPGSIYVAENCSTTLSSLSLHVRVNATHGIFKLFSRDALGPDLLDALFSSWSILHHRDWKAYPHFQPPEEMCPFILRPFERILYTSALETAVSAMEISAIAAKNSAILLAQSLGKGAWAPGARCGPKPGDQQRSGGVTAEL